MDEKAVREIKPVVVSAEFYIYGPFISGVLSLLPAFIVGTIAMKISDIPHDYLETPGGPLMVHQWALVFGYALVAYILAFIITLGFIGITIYKKPSQTLYTIFPDRIECCEGLWVKTRRTLAFDQCTDVEMSRGVLQQMYGAGTITLVTKQGRIPLNNLPEPNELYDLIRSFVLKRASA